MSQVAGEGHRFFGLDNGLIRKTEQPSTQCSVVAGANPWIMSAIEELVGSILVAVVEDHALLGLLRASRQLRQVEAGGPSGMASLQQIRRVGLPSGERKQFIR
jgi:hypothetical protein